MVLKSRTLAPDWSAGGNPDREAKCRKHPLPTNHVVNAETDPFFSDESEARHICNGTYDDRVCPFRQVCAERALINNEQSGTFGGFTTEQRRWIRRHSRKGEDPQPEPFIGKQNWGWSDGWRHLVPEPEELEEGTDADDEEAPEFAAQA